MGAAQRASPRSVHAILQRPALVACRTDAVLARYLAEGIFYVQNPNVLPRSRTLLAWQVNVAQGVDVTLPMAASM